MLAKPSHNARHALATAVLAGAFTLTAPAAHGIDPIAAGPDQLGAGAPAAALSESSQALLDELKQREHNQALRELRSTYNGDYGVSLRIAEDEVLCYVTLYYRREPWRVSRYDALAPAERAYNQFIRQTLIWSDDAIRRQVLESQRRELEKALQASEERAGILANQMEATRAQQQRIAEEQKTANIEVQAAEIAGRDIRAKLDRLQTQIQKLESELSQMNQPDAPAVEAPKARARK